MQLDLVWEYPIKTSDIVNFYRFKAESDQHKSRLREKFLYWAKVGTSRRFYKLCN